MLDDADAIMADVAEMQGTELTEREQGTLAKAAHALRFDDPAAAPITADRLLAPRRRADAGDDLWSNFNRVPENVVRSGLSGMSRDALGRCLTGCRLPGAPGTANVLGSVLLVPCRVSWSGWPGIGPARAASGL